VEVLLVAAVGAATAVATGLGVFPVWAVGSRAEALQPALEGAAAGIMLVASVAGLLLPALDEGSASQVIAGAAGGVVFLALARRLLLRREIHVRGVSDAGAARSMLVFAALFVHSLPEGLAIGTAYASSTAGLGLFVVLAIAAQNVPEGTATAIPMAEAGFSRAQQFWAAVLTSAPQPVGAVVAYLLVEQVQQLLPISFAFAAGAMLALVATDLLPAAMTRGSRRIGALGLCAGATTMLVLTRLLSV
jgi:zinc transporter, ZIP family